MKIGFVLLSPSAAPLPSTRVAVLNMLGPLRAAGFRPEIVYEPTQATPTPDIGDLAERLIASGFRIICLQKVHGPQVLRFVRRLSAGGVKTVYLVCDLVDPAMVDATDATAVVTDYLRSLYPAVLQPKIDVVHDGIERPDVCKLEWESRRGSPATPLRAVLVTSDRPTCLPVIGPPPAWLRVTVVGRYSARWSADEWRRRRWEWQGLSSGGERAAYLRACLSRRMRFVPWTADGVYDELLAADVGIIPIDTAKKAPAGKDVPDWAVKSENRLSLLMATGLPVVATPIPAYEPVVEQGRNGFLANNRTQWLECLESLLDPERRRDIGTRARECALQRFSMAKQADRLTRLLRRVVATSASC